MSTSANLARITAWYDQAVAERHRRYESTTFERVHGPTTHLLPPPPAQALDIGAGSGRDAAALCRRGYVVTAVEPSTQMRNAAIAAHGDLPITWIDDHLPALSDLQDTNAVFDIILVSAVWMHLLAEDRLAAHRTLTALLAPGGVAIVSLRCHGDDTSGTFHDVPLPEFCAQAAEAGLRVVATLAQADVMGRSDVTWHTVGLVHGA